MLLLTTFRLSGEQLDMSSAGSELPDEVDGRAGIRMTRRGTRVFVARFLSSCLLISELTSSDAAATVDEIQLTWFSEQAYGFVLAPQLTISTG